MRDSRTRARRNDQDVTGTVQTTDPASVAAGVVRVFCALFGGARAPRLERAFGDVERLYAGKHPRYCPCDTEYHDLQHVLDVTLAMARLMDGFQRGRGDSEASLNPELFTLGVVTALFHDVGYLRKRNDHNRRYGAEYTLTHVSRSGAFLRGYVIELGLGATLARAAAEIVHFTGYERPVSEIRSTRGLMRRIGQMLGTADILAQMSDRCYLEKCRDRLYPEFVLGRLAGEKRGIRPGLPSFADGDDLVHKTPAFYKGAVSRLQLQLEGAYSYAERHFGGDNLYLEAMQSNARYAEVLARTGSGERQLRRRPPRTLLPGVEPYPKELVQGMRSM